MTLRELYAVIGGDYDLAMRVLRMEKLLDKHIRKLPANRIFADLAAAGERMDATAVFESAHAIKGVCANLGLMELSSAASELAEEFRPEGERRLSDEEVKQKLLAFDELYQKTVEGVSRYAG